ncbi:DUF4097 domain-containing protein [Halalkalibacterium halodurans]|uniref:DUF4097 domain-containing protein n=1 Tax=Halalkalibacterium halodurans TaxID=86665 RepID=UPI002E1DE094|nr:DUF4097 domain-containing protein [Halalkalibacterium halodurans]
MKRVGCLVVFLLMMTGCNLVTVEEGEILSVDAQGAGSFTLDLAEGNVTIRGGDETESIEVDVSYAVTGESEEEANAFREAFTSAILQREGDVVSLNTKILGPDQAEEGRIHLMITVPSDLSIELKQAEGELLIENATNDLHINQGAGPIHLRQIRGEIHITDGAGRINIAEVDGPITVHAKTGDVTMKTITGDVAVIAGSSAITIEEVNGSVEVRGGQGKMTIDSIAGNVTLTGDGERNLSNIEGELIEQ